MAANARNRQRARNLRLLRSRRAQREWQGSWRRKNHQRLPPLLMTSTVRLNVSVVTKTSQFPLQQCWRVAVDPETDKDASSHASSVGFGLTNDKSGQL
jgi:hypothetical protein